MVKTLFCNAYEPGYLGTRILASYLQKMGYETHSILLSDFHYLSIPRPLDVHQGYQAYSKGNLSVNKATFFPITNQELELLHEAISEYKPDIIGFSARSTNNWLIPVLIPVFKAAAPKAFLLAGGFGPTLEPDLYLNGGFDCVVRCDGEEAMLELVQCIERQNMDAIRLIRNTVWKNEDGTLQSNPLRPQTKELSRYGEPLHGDDFFTFINEDKIYKNYDPTVRSGMYLTYFGRGCIGKCSYCSGGQWSDLYKQENSRCYKRRNRDIDELLDELKKLPESVKHIWFVDEYFALPSDKSLYFFSEYKKHIKKTFFTYLNYYYLLEHRDVFKMIIDAGLVGTGIGFQTGSQKFAKDCYNRDNDNERLLEYANILFENSLYIGIHIIGGNCYESEEILQDTINLIRKLPFNIEDPFRVNIENIRLRPHPKTPITFQFPRVVTNPMPASEWYYRAILLELARIVDADELQSIRKEKFFHDRPELLNQFFISLLHEKQANHYYKLLQNSHKKYSKNSNWVFYGAGDIYHTQKRLFSCLHPQYILFDKGYLPDTDNIDGINVIEVNDFFAQFYQNNNFLIFSREAKTIQSRLHRSYNVPNEMIHCVTSNTLYQIYTK